MYTFKIPMQKARPTYVSQLHKKLLLKCAGPQINHTEYMKHEIILVGALIDHKKGKHGQPG